MQVIGPELQSMLLADGTRLDADVWRPQGTGPWPVLLQRQAYGRRIACTMCYAHPAWYAAQGYVVVVQDIRGRGTSEGVFQPGLNDAQDGFEAVEWAARLPWSNGKVGMYGFSYQAYAQFMAVKAAPPSLKAIAPAMGPWDPEQDWVYDSGGALRLTDTLSWGFQVAAETARRQGAAAAYADLHRAAIAPPVYGAVSAWPELVETLAGECHLAHWLNQPAGAPFWRDLSADGAEKTLRANGIAVLILAGWYDLFLCASLKAWRKIGADQARLVVGPWRHFPWRGPVGGTDFGDHADLDTDRLHIAFFDRALKGEGQAALQGVSFFDTGAGAWCEGDPVLPPQPLWLCAQAASPIGRVAVDEKAGGLCAEPDGGECEEFLVHDPWRPAPATSLSAGPVDQRPRDGRGDVMTFTSGALAQDILYAGTGRARLHISCDRPSFDLSLVLSRIRPDGAVLPFAEAYHHCRRAPVEPLCIDLSPAVIRLHKGERLRLSIAAACFPQHPINPGTGQDPVQAARTDALVSTLRLRLHISGIAPLMLPIDSIPAFCPRP